MSERSQGDRLACLVPADFDAFSRRFRGPQPQRRRVSVDLATFRLTLDGADEDTSMLWEVHTTRMFLCKLHI